jgi:transposase
VAEANRNGAGGRGAERAVGERSVAASGGAPAAGVPDPELVERPRRRRFSPAYKLRILQEADSCTRPGELGALLRREGLYSSNLSAWRRQRDEGALSALSRPRGRPKADPLATENEKLRSREGGAARLWSLEDSNLRPHGCEPCEKYCQHPLPSALTLRIDPVLTDTLLTPLIGCQEIRNLGSYRVPRSRDGHGRAPPGLRILLLP